jgi:hypothetical protein
MIVSLVLVLFLIVSAVLTAWADHRFNGPERLLAARERRADWFAR